MTDTTQQPPGKRDRLVGAAHELFHHRGVERTSLADIAGAADVPLGNVYYYFKTKDDIIRAVIDTHADRLQEALRRLDRHRGGAARLIAFTRDVAATGPDTARYGCPHGTLCSELGRRSDDLTDAAAALMQIRVDWAREQFEHMGRKDAQELAITFVANVQGAALLANVYRDPALLTAQVQHLQRWIRSLGRP